MADRRVLADKKHRLAPPPWRIFDALTAEVPDWLTLRSGEVAPDIVTADRPTLVVWSSLWPISPDDTVEFRIDPDGAGSAVRLLWNTSSPPDDRGIGLVRHRLNYAIGGELREFVDTRG